MSYENRVAWAAKQSMGGAPLLRGAVRVTMYVDCAIPVSWSRVKQQRALDGLVHPTVKPDIDNIEKVIYDALNGVVWKDDVQVVEVCKAKRYSESPGVYVCVEAIA